MNGEDCIVTGCEDRSFKILDMKTGTLLMFLFVCLFVSFSFSSETTGTHILLTLCFGLPLPSLAAFATFSCAII